MTDGRTTSGNLEISDVQEIGGIHEGTVTIRADAFCVLRGIVHGDVLIEPGGAASIRGTIDGSIRNDGGLLNITGVVEGNVITISGRTNLEPGGVIKGVQTWGQSHRS